MKKVPMIILLLAPYVFLLICIGICMAFRWEDYDLAKGAEY